MRRILALLGALLLLSGCTVAPAEREALTLEYRGVAVRVGTAVEPLLTLWGDDYTLSESESCAGVGMDRLYAYPSMRLYTFAPEGAVERVTAISYTDDGADTRGARIGSAVEQLVAAFGTPDEQDDTALVYRDASATLKVTLRDGRATGITLSE